MADRYWVGTGNWTSSNTANWSTTSGGATGASVPTSADAVFFDANSGQCSMGSGLFAASITCTGYTNAWQGASSANTTTVSGNITLASTMTQSTASTFVIAATATIITAGKQFNSLTVDASGGTVTLGDAFNVTDKFTVTNGTFTTSASNYSMSVGSFLANTLGTRTITLNASTVTVTGYNTTSPFDLSGSTVTFNAGTSTINVSAANPSFTGGGKTFRNVAFTDSTPGNGPTIIDGNTFNQLTFTAPSSVGVTSVGFVASQTITTMVCSGAAANRRISLGGYGSAQATLNITTWTTISDVDFLYIALNTVRSGTRLGNLGGNSNITFPAAKTVYWNLAGTNSWGAVGWATTSGGAPSINNFPLAQDTAIFNNSSAGTQVNLDSWWGVGTIDMSARTTALTINVVSPYVVFCAGNWTNGSGTTISGTGRLYFCSGATQTLTSAGKTFTNTFTTYVASTNLSLQDAFTCSNVNSNGFDITASTTITLNNNSLTLSGNGINVSNRGTISLGTGTLTIAGSGASAYQSISSGTITGTGTVSLTSASAKTFAGGSKSYSLTLNQGGAGALTITGSNSFGNITASYTATGACSILFTAGTTSTFSNWNASGTVGKLLTIGSVTAASHTLSKSSGTVSADYLSISRSTATGGATWYAGANSTNGGNNTGWIFSAAPSASANFLMFFM